MPQYVVAPPPKSQYEIERDERIKRNEEYLLSIGINPRGGGYMKPNKKRSSRRKRVRVVDDLSDERRAGLEKFTLNLDAFLDGFEAWMESDGEHPVSEQNRRSVMRQVRKLVSGEGVHYASPQYGWRDDVIFRKDQPVTMQSDAVPNQFRASRHQRDDLHRSDIGKIIEDAREFEDTHGRDHGTDPCGNQTVSYGDIAS